MTKITKRLQLRELASQMPETLTKIVCVKSLAFLLCFLPTLAQAEFHCTSSVAYKVKKGLKGDGDTEEHAFARVQVKGADEAQSKQALSLELAKIKKKAQEECHQKHERPAACAAAKYTAMSSTLKSMSFTARKKLEEAIVQECEILSGHCAEVLSSEPECKEIVDTSAKADTTPGAGEADGKGKDGKKDPKKGKK